MVGKQLQLDRQNYTIIGVLPPRFRWGNSDVYKPLAMTSDPNRIYIVDARLKAGVSNQKAEAEMQPLLEQFAKETPEHFPPGFRVHVASLTGIAAGSLKGNAAPVVRCRWCSTGGRLRERLDPASRPWHCTPARVCRARGARREPGTAYSDSCSRNRCCWRWPAVRRGFCLRLPG